MNFDNLPKMIITTVVTITKNVTTTIYSSKNVLNDNKMSHFNL